MAATFSLKELEDDPRLFLYTSLTAGSSHIITATSRMETILKANRIPFQAIDIATDEKARRLWQRRAGQRKLPGLVKQGYVIGDLNEIEEWNEFGELKENIGPVPANNAAPPGGQVGVNIAPPSMPVKPAATSGSTTIRQPAAEKAPAPGFDKSKAIRLPGAEELMARNKEKAAAAAATVPAASSTPSTSTLGAINPETLASSPADKKESIDKAKEVATSKIEETTPVAAASAPEIETPAVKADDAAVEQPEASTSGSAPVDETLSSAMAEKAEAVKTSPEQAGATEKSESQASETAKTENLSSAAATEKVEASESNPEPSTENVESKDAAPMQQNLDESVKIEHSQEPSDKAVTEKEQNVETEAATKGVSNMSIGAEKTQEQDPKDGENAAKSVED